MRFWDASALVPLIVQQEASARVREVAAHDAGVTTWWATPVECMSAIARLDRDGRLSAAVLADSIARLRAAITQWTEVWPTSELREHAMRIVRVHGIRAGDALQLGAAMVASDYRPRAMEFVTLDERLAAAADKEGFRVISA